MNCEIESDCQCGYNQEHLQCIEGIVYGYCEHEMCGGGCEPESKCDCKCHKDRYKKQKSFNK